MSNKKLWRKALIAFAVLAVALAVIPAASAEEDPGVLLRDYPFGAAEQLYDSELQVTNLVGPGVVNILRGLDADATPGQPPFAPANNPLNAAVAIPMTAQIGGAGGGTITPTLFCKWELPDMLQDGPDFPIPGFVDYSDVAVSWSVAEHLAGVTTVPNGSLPISLNPWDDDNLRPVPEFPCAFGAGALPEYANNATNVIQVRANIADGNAAVVGPDPLTVERTIELWAAVGPIDTVNDVYWKIFHPDGSIKTQVHGGEVACDAVEFGAQSGNPALQPATMFWAANGTGQIDNAAITNDGSNGMTGLVGACQQDQLEYWKATFDLSKHQPCGEYKVEVTANNFGAEATLTNFLDVICFHELAVDFTEVAFGQIEAFPQTSYKLGDLFFDPNGQSASPTVKNLGSGGMEIGVEFYTMYEDDTPGPKYIDEFDAKLGITPSQLQEIGSNDAGAFPGLGADGTWLAVDSPDGLGGQNPIAWFGTSDWQTVCSNEVAKLDVSVHPSATSGSGAFSGGIKIYARADTATDDMNNVIANVNDVTLDNPQIDGAGNYIAALAPRYTCNNDNGLWGGYHDTGDNNVRNGNGYNGIPFGAAFDDKYYDPANNGTVDLSTEAGSSNQRSIHNQ